LDFVEGRGLSVRAKFDLGDGKLIEERWKLLDRNRQPVSGGILGIKILLDKLGLKDGSFQATEESLAEILSDITDDAPSVRIKVIHKDGFQNVRVLGLEI
jgi:hypothetical protein